ncbi:MAG TPA: hypothetical protein DGT23_20430 [Micromonosporaceae bacterium]|nr:hypothetical protein [Micromonosporaceae bacterium]
MTSDAALVIAAASADRAAFDQLYHRYRPGLISFVQRQVGDHHLAEDIVQETFLVAWRDLCKLRDPASVKTWLFSIAYRRAMTHARQPVLVPLLEAANLADDTVGPESVAEQREAQELVWSAAHGLEPRQRAVLELAVRWELSSKEIADVLGVGRAHAAVLVHRARSALGTAVKAMVVARQRGRCRGLERLLGGTQWELNARQRSSADHHIRRCPDCKRLSTHALSHATLALLLGKTNSSAATVHSGALLLKLSGAALAVSVAAGAVAYAISGDPQSQAPIIAGAITSSPAATPSSTPSPSASPSPSPSPSKLSPEAQMVVLINERRADAGCAPVSSNEKLTQAAKAHSADMAANEYFSHTSLDASSPWDRAKRAGYQWPSAENIAAGNASAKATMDQLMNSPGHKANILNCHHKAVGIGRATGGPYRYYWTQLFGSR